MTDLAVGASAPDDLFATTSKTSSGFAWSAQAKPLSGNLLKLGFYLFMLAHALNILILLVMLWTFRIIADGGTIEDPTIATMISAMGSFAQLLSPILLGVFIYCTIFYLLFVYRAARNLELSRARGMTTTPAWAVGWSFIPFANLIAICNVMRQIWVASNDPVKGERSASPRIILWWVLYIAGNLMTRASDAMIADDAGEDPAALFSIYFPGSTVAILGSIAAIASTLILHTIITQIVRAQRLMQSTSVFED